MWFHSKHAGSLHLVWNCVLQHTSTFNCSFAVLVWPRSSVWVNLSSFEKKWISQSCTFYYWYHIFKKLATKKKVTSALKIDILGIRGALENCRWRENEENGVAGKWGFVFPCRLTFHHWLQPLCSYYCPGLEFLLCSYYIWIKLAISFQEEQIFSSAIWIFKDWAVLSGAVMQELRQCPTCRLSCVGKTTQWFISAPSWWQRRGNSLI